MSSQSTRSFHEDIVAPCAEEKPVSPSSHVKVEVSKEPEPEPEPAPEPYEASELSSEHWEWNQSKTPCPVTIFIQVLKCAFATFMVAPGFFVLFVQDANSWDACGSIVPGLTPHLMLSIFAAASSMCFCVWATWIRGSPQTFNWTCVAVVVWLAWTALSIPVFIVPRGLGQRGSDSSHCELLQDFGFGFSVVNIIMIAGVSVLAIIVGCMVAKKARWECSRKCHEVCVRKNPYDDHIKPWPWFWVVVGICFICILFLGLVAIAVANVVFAILYNGSQEACPEFWWGVMWLPIAGATLGIAALLSLIPIELCECFLPIVWIGIIIIAVIGNPSSSTKSGRLRTQTRTRTACTCTGLVWLTQWCFIFLCLRVPACSCAMPCFNFFLSKWIVTPDLCICICTSAAIRKYGVRFNLSNIAHHVLHAHTPHDHSRIHRGAACRVPNLHCAIARVKGHLEERHGGFLHGHQTQHVPQVRPLQHKLVAAAR